MKINSPIQILKLLIVKSGLKYLEWHHFVAEVFLALMVEIVDLLKPFNRHRDHFWLLWQCPGQLNFIKCVVDLHLLHIIRLKILQLRIPKLRIILNKRQYS